MKILSVDVVNFKKIEALHLELDGQNLRVAGTTGQGKTTAISSLWDILETVGDPIRHESARPGVKASVRLVIGDAGSRWIAERTYTAGTTKISIKSEDGKNSATAKEFRSWVSSLAKNPHKLLELGPQDQTAALLQAARFPVGLDLDALDRKRATAHERREEARKDVQRLGAEVGIRPREVARVNLQETLGRLQELKADQTNATASRDGRARELAQVDQEIEDAAARLEALRLRRVQVAELLAELEAWIRDNVDPAEISRLEEDLARCEEINREAETFEAWTKANAKLEASRATFQEQDQVVRGVEEDKRKALESVEWPVPGLSIEEGEIRFHGVPLVQCGNSEQLLVCGALAAHQIAQSRLRVVRLDGIESMSSEDFAALEAIFQAHDVQVLASRVTRGDLEDGELLIHEGQVLEVEP